MGQCCGEGYGFTPGQIDALKKKPETIPPAPKSNGSRLPWLILAAIAALFLSFFLVSQARERQTSTPGPAPSPQTFNPPPAGSNKPPAETAPPLPTQPTPPRQWW